MEEEEIEGNENEFFNRGYTKRRKRTRAEQLLKAQQQIQPRRKQTIVLSESQQQYYLSLPNKDEQRSFLKKINQEQKDMVEQQKIDQQNYLEQLLKIQNQSSFNKEKQIEIINKLLPISDPKPIIKPVLNYNKNQLPPPKPKPQQQQQTNNKQTTTALSNEFNNHYSTLIVLYRNYILDKFQLTEHLKLILFGSIDDDNKKSIIIEDYFKIIEEIPIEKIPIVTFSSIEKKLGEILENSTTLSKIFNNLNNNEKQQGYNKLEFIEPDPHKYEEKANNEDGDKINEKEEELVEMSIDILELKNKSKEDIIKVAKSIGLISSSKSKAFKSIKNYLKTYKKKKLIISQQRQINKPLSKVNDNTVTTIQLVKQVPYREHNERLFWRIFKNPTLFRIIFSNFNINSNNYGLGKLNFKYNEINHIRWILDNGYYNMLVEKVLFENPLVGGEYRYNIDQDKNIKIKKIKLKKEDINSEDDEDSSSSDSMDSSSEEEEEVIEYEEEKEKEERVSLIFRDIIKVLNNQNGGDFKFYQILFIKYKKYIISINLLGEFIIRFNNIDALHALCSQPYNYYQLKRTVGSLLLYSFSKGIKLLVNKIRIENGKSQIAVQEICKLKYDFNNRHIKYQEDLKKPSKYIPQIHERVRNEKEYYNGLIKRFRKSFKILLYLTNQNCILIDNQEIDLCNKNQIYNEIIYLLKLQYQQLNRFHWINSLKLKDLFIIIKLLKLYEPLKEEDLEDEDSDSEAKSTISMSIETVKSILHLESTFSKEDDLNLNIRNALQKNYYNFDKYYSIKEMIIKYLKIVKGSNGIKELSVTAITGIKIKIEDFIKLEQEDEIEEDDSHLRIKEEKPKIKEIEQELEEDGGYRDSFLEIFINYHNNRNVNGDLKLVKNLVKYSRKLVTSTNTYNILKESLKYGYYLYWKEASLAKLSKNIFKDFDFQGNQTILFKYCKNDKKRQIEFINGITECIDSSTLSVVGIIKFRLYAFILLYLVIGTDDLDLVKLVVLRFKSYIDFKYNKASDSIFSLSQNSFDSFYIQNFIQSTKMLDYCFENFGKHFLLRDKLGNEFYFYRFRSLDLFKRYEYLLSNKSILEPYIEFKVLNYNDFNNPLDQIQDLYSKINLIKLFTYIIKKPNNYKINQLVTNCWEKEDGSMIINCKYNEIFEKVVLPGIQYIIENTSIETTSPKVNAKPMVFNPAKMFSNSYQVFKLLEWVNYHSNDYIRSRCTFNYSFKETATQIGRNGDTDSLGKFITEFETKLLGQQLFNGLDGFSDLANSVKECDGDVGENSLYHLLSEAANYGHLNIFQHLFNNHENGLFIDDPSDQKQQEKEKENDQFSIGLIKYDQLRSIMVIAIKKGHLHIMDYLISKLGNSFHNNDSKKYLYNYSSNNY